MRSIENTRRFQYCLTTFKEMINAGITTVGEFHYVHHSEQKLVLKGKCALMRIQIADSTSTNP